MSSKKKNFARFGLATKGIVYFIIGGLTAFAAFGGGGQKAGSDTALDFIAQQDFGKILLVLTGLGLLGYLFWRWYQAFADPKGVGTDTKGMVKRVSYFGSGLFYGALAYSAISRGTGGSSSSGNNSMLSKALNSDYAVTIAIVIGLILLGKAIYEIYQAYSGKFREEVDEADIPQEAHSLIIKSGKVGLTSRGIIAGIMAFLMFRTAFSGGAEKVSKTDAFSFLQNEFGTVVMGIIAAGLVAYGVFMIVKAKYSSLAVS
ncbi:DUF1206 domain-containing protein [Flavobacteriaceae bacterium TK19130]|nr:DUF1206 domain-containing protein [Thermobacterium salinum]